MKDEATYKRLMALCKVEGDCRIWPNKPNPNSSIYVSIGGKKRLVRRVLWEAKYGPIRPTISIGYYCETDGCVEHLQALTPSQVREKAAKKFTKRMDYRVKMARARAQYRKFSDEAVEAVRSAEKGAIKATAAAHGMSAKYAHDLRNGKFRVDYTNPFAGLVL